MENTHTSIQSVLIIEMCHIHKQFVYWKRKSTFSKNKAVVCDANDKVKKIVVALTSIIELDLKSEYLFRTLCGATNLVTSIEYSRIRCATMLCLFGQTGNSSVTTNFVLISITLTRSATGGYVVVSESFGQNEETAGSNEKRTREKAISFLKKTVLTDAMIIIPNNQDLPLKFSFNFDELHNFFRIWKNYWFPVCTII